MKRKEIEERKNNFEFFSNYIDISKISLLYNLNKEIQDLNTIKSLRKSHSVLLSKINEKWLKKYNNYYLNVNKKLPSLYILVDAKQDDEYAEIALNKLKEIMVERITLNDYVITIGWKTHKLAESIGFQIIDKLDFSAFEKIDLLSERLSSILEIGLQNYVFSKSVLLIAENDIETKGIIEKIIIPFDKSSLEQKMEILDDDGIPIKDDEFEEDENWISHYEDIINAIDLRKNKWKPDVVGFYNKMSKALIKSEFYEIKIKRNIQTLKLQLAILEDKKRNVNEQLEDLQKKWNKVRKEETTNKSLILFAAFKAKKKQLELSDLEEKKAEKLADKIRKTNAIKNKEHILLKEEESLTKATTNLKKVKTKEPQLEKRKKKIKEEI
ncbi:MMOB1630 family gliding motility ATPase complex subunit [Mycoplasmopsis pulmonis]|uniref:MMOB1630 family gliding motility ATPase complex subunit n=1 Tax=Mycoplasmopsis pulmonis TaxID=2107 RepID=UPI0010052633|nr:hypothetical protein [Mycoplasmopsis pulmonis]VEU67992.1 Uncharacterised protein [Mycoplasmopsis pulmonis]